LTLCSTRLTSSSNAPPGAGKTTRVPPAILGFVSGEVIVLEPRRIAARMAARRVAAELGEAVGETVGYQVRFEERISPKTRLRFVTEGILTRRLLTDPTLKGVDAVVLDEFHERHLESDLALALLKRLQRSRPELRILVMSATLDAGPIAAYLGACPILRSEGRLPLTPFCVNERMHKALAWLDVFYSALRASVGLTVVARTAGMIAARAAIKVKVVIVTQTESGSTVLV
jgi:ATP-dependent helicase HrpB